jgi:hypothetical protein
MHCTYFSWFVFDEFIVKGERMCTKWYNSFANRVVERRLWKHDKFYLRGRACIEKVRESAEFFFAFSFVICTFLPNFDFYGSLILDNHFLACLWFVVI